MRQKSCYLESFRIFLTLDEADKGADGADGAEGGEGAAIYILSYNNVKILSLEIWHNRLVGPIFFKRYQLCS